MWAINKLLYRYYINPYTKCDIDFSLPVNLGKEVRFIIGSISLMTGGCLSLSIILFDSYVKLLIYAVFFGITHGKRKLNMQSILQTVLFSNENIKLYWKSFKICTNTHSQTHNYETHF